MLIYKLHEKAMRVVLKSFRKNESDTRMSSIDSKHSTSNLTGYILVAVFPEKYSQFCKFCQDTPAITAHHHLVGKLNALMRFAVKDTRELDKLLASIKRYGDSQTSVELGSYFEYKDVPLPK